MVCWPILAGIPANKERKKMSYDFNDSLTACENVLKYDFEKDWNGQPTTDKHKIETLVLYLS